MTNQDPIPPPTTPPPGIRIEPSRFNWGLFIAGLIMTLAIGGVGNIFSGLMGGDTHSRPLGFLVGIIPGVVFMLLFLLARRNGFGHGMLIGGCIIALVGGACGAAMVGTTFH